MSTKPSNYLKCHSNIVRKLDGICPHRGISKSGAGEVSLGGIVAAGGRILMEVPHRCGLDLLHDGFDIPTLYPPARSTTAISCPFSPTRTNETTLGGKSSAKVTSNPVPVDHIRANPAQHIRPAIPTIAPPRAQCVTFCVENLKTKSSVGFG